MYMITLHFAMEHDLRLLTKIQNRLTVLIAKKIITNEKLFNEFLDVGASEPILDFYKVTRHKNHSRIGNFLDNIDGDMHDNTYILMYT